jgi:hypothetical protein
VSLLTPSSRRATNRARTRGDALRLLADGGCPACRRDADSQRRWINSYVHEGNVDSEIIAGLRASRGFCAAHTRVLLARTDAPFVLPASLIETINARLPDLAAGPAPGTTCPPCLSGRRAATDVLDMVASVIDDPAVVGALETTDFCLAHTVQLGRSAAVRAFSDRFAGLTGTAALGPITGDDPDADARARSLPALYETDDAEEKTVRELALRQAMDAVGIDSCPGCRAGGVAAVRYLRWLGEARQDLDRKLDPVQTPLCKAHLHDLSTVDPLTASWIADLEHPVIATRIDRLATALGSGRRGPGDALRRYRATVRPCPACRSAERAVDRLLALLAAALPDAGLRRALESGHGLCVVHAPVVAARSGDSLPLTVLRARLQVLGWELAESQRKREWWTRHERQGSEMSAWRRAPTHLVGDAYLGLSAERS